jgi:hypothetical protein
MKLRREMGLVWVLPFTLVLGACSGSSSKAVMGQDAGAGGEAGSADGAAGHADGGAPNGGEAGGSAAGEPAGGSAGEAGETGGPIVVATISAAPAALDLTGGVLYFTVKDGVPGEGKVQSVSVNGGTVSTLASALPNPRNIAVNDGNVYWADTETVFPDAGDVMAVPVAGGTPHEVATCETNARLVINGSTLYCLTNDLTKLSAFPLTGAAGVGTPVAASSHGAVEAYDSDGSSVFWFAAAAVDFDLYRTPVLNPSDTDLAMAATSGSAAFDYLTHDTSALYWSDSGTGGVYSLPKAGGTPLLLASYETASAPVQLLLDGNTIYALRSNTLTKFPKTGGTPTVLASVSGTGTDRYVADTVNASALAVDDQFVYWTYQGHDQILKIAK